jgi:hypothetical protein
MKPVLIVVTTYTTCTTSNSVNLHMMRLQGVKKTSSFTGVSRTTLWRWNKFGVQPKKQKSIPNVCFNTIKHIFLSILESKPCVAYNIDHCEMQSRLVCHVCVSPGVALAS